MTWMTITRHERHSPEVTPPPPPKAVGFLHRRRVAATTGVALLVAAAAVATWKHDQHRTGITFGAAAAWLPSEQVGELTLVDGPSATVVTGVKVAAAGNLLTAAQHGLTAFVFNGSTSELSRIDGATREVSPPLHLRVSRPETATLTVSATSVFLNRFSGGHLEHVDPNAPPFATAAPTTATRSPDPAYERPGAPVRVVLDNSGRPWTLSPALDAIVRAPDGHRIPLPSENRAATERLAPTGGVPAIVNLSAGTVSWLTDSGAVRHREPLQKTLSPTTMVTGDLSSGQIYAVDPQTRTVVICHPQAPACEPARNLPDTSPRLGTPTVIAGRLLVPDLGTGSVWIIAPSGQLTARAPLFHRPATFTLTEVNGIVFFNEASTNHAGILDLDGHVHPILKYGIQPPEPTPTTTIAPTTSPATPPPPTTTSPTTGPRPPSPTSTQPSTTGPTPTTTTQAPAPTTTKHPPSPTPTTTPPTTPIRTRSSGTIVGPPGGTAKSCAYFSGTSDLAPGKTLILAKKNLDNGDPQEYVEYVFGWENPENLSHWRGRQYFAKAEHQHLQVRLIAVDLTAAQAAHGHTAATNALASQGEGLGSVTVHIEPGEGPDNGSCDNP